MGVISKMEQSLEEKILNDFSEHLKQVMREKKISYSAESNSYDTILAYLTATEKWITQQQRHVHLSTELKEKMQKKKFYDDEKVEEAEEIKRLIEHFENLFRLGKNVNNHLSSQIYTSKRQDALLNSWNVKHIHLNELEAESKSAMKRNRSAWLLFCIVNEEDVFFLDVRAHPQKEEFSSFSLLKIIHHNHWMSKIGFEEIGDGYVPYSMKPQITDDYALYQVYNELCGNLAFDFEGRGYIKFSGIVSTGDKTGHSLYLTKLLANIRKFPYCIEEYKGFIPSASNIGDGYVVFEKDNKVIKFILKIDGIKGL